MLLFSKRLHTGYTMGYTINVPKNIQDRQEIYKFIVDSLLKDLGDPNKPDNVANQFLLQYGYWRRNRSYSDDDSDDDSGYITYIALWNDIPFYDLDGLEIRTDGRDTEVTIASWKGNHEDSNDLGCGNLDYNGPWFNFVGTCWTRGCSFF